MTLGAQFTSSQRVLHTPYYEKNGWQNATRQLVKT